MLKKFKITTEEQQLIEMPPETKILSVGVINNEPYIWGVTSNNLSIKKKIAYFRKEQILSDIGLISEHLS